MPPSRCNRVANPSDSCLTCNVRSVTVRLRFQTGASAVALGFGLWALGFGLCALCFVKDQRSPDGHRNFRRLLLSSTWTALTRQRKAAPAPVVSRHPRWQLWLWLGLRMARLRDGGTLEYQPYPASNAPRASVCLCKIAGIDRASIQMAQQSLFFLCHSSSITLSPPSCKLAPAASRHLNSGLLIKNQSTNRPLSPKPPLQNVRLVNRSS